MVGSAPQYGAPSGGVEFAAAPPHVQGRICPSVGAPSACGVRRSSSGSCGCSQATHGSLSYRVCTMARPDRDRGRAGSFPRSLDVRPLAARSRTAELRAAELRAAELRAAPAAALGRARDRGGDGTGDRRRRTRRGSRRRPVSSRPHSPGARRHQPRGAARTRRAAARPRPPPTRARRARKDRRDSATDRRSSRDAGARGTIARSPATTLTLGSTDPSGYEPL